MGESYSEVGTGDILGIYSASHPKQTSSVPAINQCKNSHDNNRPRPQPLTADNNPRDQSKQALTQASTDQPATAS